MKKILQSALVLGVLMVAGAGLLNAQGAGRASFHVGGGVVLPQGDFNTGFKMGWQGMGGVAFGLSGIPIIIRVDGAYGQNNCDGADCKVKLFSGLLGGQYNIGAAAAAVHPYVLAQVGMTNGKFTFPSNTAFNSSETKFTWAGGGGVNFGMGSMHVFVEAKYLAVQTSDGSTKMIPIIVGFQFGGGM
ncbi:MAG: hypothetical protein ABI836_13120 [Gemmatimonadota bacterium]